MSEITALKAMLEHSNYVKYSGVLLQLDNLEKEHKQLLMSIKEYYKKYQDKKIISIDELESFFYFLNPMISKKSYDLLFNELRTTEVGNPDLIKDILNHVVEIHTCAKIAPIAISVAERQAREGTAAIKVLLTEQDDLIGELVDPLEMACTTPLAELLAKEKVGGVSWSLDFLNEIFGPLRPRTLGHIIARPDGGKTSFALHQIAFFAAELRRMGKQLLFMSNEEDIERVRLRLYSAMLGWDMDFIEAHVGRGEREFAQKGGDSIILLGDVDHITKVEGFIHNIRPYLAVIDQGPKVGFPGAKLNEVERKQRLYERYRKIAKDYDCIFISVGQADNASEGRKWIGLSNLDGSKVGIPGELDWCLGIGKSNEPGYEMTRYLNVAKNKLTPRFGRTEVYFNPERCRYEDLKKEGKS